MKHEPSSRTTYWKEFDESDPRRAASEQLALLLGPQWLTEDVVRHINWLISWEIRRAKAADGTWKQLDETRPIDLSGWELVRDYLVDLWDWWAEGAHLRPQPFRPRGKNTIEYASPYAVRLAEEIAPADLERNQLPEPVRVTTIDAHLGDALFRLNSIVHFEINRATGWLDRESSGPGSLPNTLWEGAAPSAETKRRYRTRITQGDRTWWAFAPATPDGKNSYMNNYVSRINAAGWRPSTGFPIGINMLGVDFLDCSFILCEFNNVTMDFSRLSNTFFGGCTFRVCSLCNVKADDVFMFSTNIGRTMFNGTNLTGARFSEIVFSNDSSTSLETKFRDALLTGVKFVSTILVDESGVPSHFKGFADTNSDT